MKRVSNFTIEFVDYMPSTLEQGVLYVSMRYATVVHLCACGCGEKVVTPLSPSDWSLAFDGETISLSPSIGNWDFHCRSHYWIKRSRVVMAEPWNAVKEEQLSGVKLRRKKKGKKKGQIKPSTANESSNRGKRWRWLSNLKLF